LRKNKLENGFNISHSSEEILTNMTLEDRPLDFPTLRMSYRAQSLLRILPVPLLHDAGEMFKKHWLFPQRMMSCRLTSRFIRTGTNYFVLETE
jgi:hypothetical protein